MYQQPKTPEVEIIDDEEKVEEEAEVMCHPRERYMARMIESKCDVCGQGPKECISAYTERDCNIAYKDFPKVYCKECSDTGQSL